MRQPPNDEHIPASLLADPPDAKDSGSVEQILGMESRPLPFDWGALVPRLVHPMKVTIIEALSWIGEPLSATDFRKLLDGGFSVGFISYHLKGVAKTGVLEMVRERPARNSREKFYFFA
ncbi:MAG TPA: hypothetical protein VEW07_09320 [Solirubrobacterales bacterium]|nr:hypothetical protein [Solirubrobacterales bacterium]